MLLICSEWNKVQSESLNDFLVKNSTPPDKICNRSAVTLDALGRSWSREFSNIVLSVPPRFN